MKSVVVAQRVRADEARVPPEQSVADTSVTDEPNLWEARSGTRRDYPALS